MLNPIVNSIAIGNGIVSLAVGALLFGPSAMSLAAGTNTKPSMILLGCSGLSIIPCAIIATNLSLITDDLGYQAINAIPILGMGIGIISEQFGPK